MRFSEKLNRLNPFLFINCVLMARLRREGKLPPKEKPIERRSNGPELDLRDSRGKEKKETGPMFHQAVKKMMPQVPDFEKEKKEMERKMKEQMEKMKELEKKEMEFKMQKQKEEERKLVDEKRKLAMYNEKKKQDYEKRREEERRKEMERMRMRKSEGNKKEMEDMKAKYKEMERKMEEMKRRLNGGAGSSSSSGKRDVREVEARRFPGEKGYREEVNICSFSLQFPPICVLYHLPFSEVEVVGAGRIE